MEAAKNKTARMLQLKKLLLAHPHGLTKAEIARRLGVHRSTAGRYVNELGQQLHLPVWEDGNYIGINREDYEIEINLNIHESMALHLATRLMATRMDKHNPHAAGALRQLGEALVDLSPHISRHLRLSADVMDDAGQRFDPNYLRVLEVLTRAWSEGKMVHLWYRKQTAAYIYEYDFAPYFIEPYAIGQTTYVIGQKKEPPALRTFKIERIERAELLDETYAIPTEFDPQTQLADAWGIWYTDREPEKVVLWFHSRVADRVEETRWHRSEETTRRPDGSLLWQARVAQPKEMRPFIRGWGADCEVLEPDWLRQEIAAEVKEMVKLYEEK